MRLAGNASGIKPGKRGRIREREGDSERPDYARSRLALTANNFPSLTAASCVD